MHATPTTDLRSIHSIHAERQALVARRAKVRAEDSELSYRIAEIDAAKNSFLPSYEAKQRLDLERLYLQYRDCAGVDAARDCLMLHGHGAETAEACAMRWVPDVIWALLHCIIAEGKVPNV